ncbi:MAG: hypothetical protein Q8R55_07865 [Candidatus Taylorbacteria bacterium]|nr:hypothetical protein [Candidatus Taylorbacteria bacterium]
MDALGQLLVYIFVGGIWVAIILTVCIVGIIYNLVKYPKESSRLLLSLGCSTLIVILIVFLTKSWWLDLDTKIESSIIGIFSSLILILIIGYGINNYLSKNNN